MSSQANLGDGRLLEESGVSYMDAHDAKGADHRRLRPKMCIPIIDVNGKPRLQSQKEVTHPVPESAQPTLVREIPLYMPVDPFPLHRHHVVKDIIGRQTQAKGTPKASAPVVNRQPRLDPGI